MKILLITILISTATTTFKLDQKVTYQLSSDSLDNSKRMPVSGISIKLKKRNDQTNA
ncbi:hypothetical protein [Spirosoma telluris]|uniref:hypothetical protein n=1 Tax=Spirosoma telluris TaxID=2183553 RepID=UPI0018DB204C